MMEENTTMTETLTIEEAQRSVKELAEQYLEKITAFDQAKEQLDAATVAMEEAWCALFGAHPTQAAAAGPRVLTGVGCMCSNVPGNGPWYFPPSRYELEG